MAISASIEKTVWNPNFFFSEENNFVRISTPSPDRRRHLTKPLTKSRAIERRLKYFDSSSKLANEASSLIERGQFSRAAEQWLKVFQLSPTVLKYLDQAIYLYGLAGHFHRVVELLNTWETYSPQQPHRFANLAPQVRRFMDAKQVEDIQLEGLINLAMTILLQNRLPVLPALFNLSLMEDEESQWYHYGIPVSDLSVEDMVKLDLELVNSLTKTNLPVNLAGYFVTLFEAFGVE